MRKKKIILIGCLILIIVVIAIFILTRKDTTNNAINLNLVEDDIYTYQKKVDELLSKELDNKKNTIKEPYVVLNPYKLSPLSAIIIFNTKYETNVSYTVNGVEYKIDEVSYAHSIPVYYLKADFDNKVVLKTSKDEKEIIIKTNKTNLSNMTVSVEGSEKDVYFLTTPSGNGVAGYNGKGEVVWYIDSSLYYGDMEMIDETHFYINNAIGDGIMGQSSGVVKMDLLGKIHGEYLIDGGVHHEVNVLQNGDILVNSSNPSNSREFDFIYVLDNKGNVVKEIDLYEIVKKIDPVYASKLDDTWAWNNSTYLDGNNLILSLRNRSSVISLNYDTLEINWIFGKLSNWSSKFEKYMLNSLDNVYTQGQHTASLDGNTLMVFDNGYPADAFNDIACNKLKNNYSSVKIFNIDGKNIKLIKEYKTDKQMFSYALSSVFKLENNNYLINFGWEFDRKVYDDNSCTALTNDDLSNRVIETDSNFNIIFDGSLHSGEYRAYKYKFNYKNNYTFDNFVGYNNFKDKYYKSLTNDEVNALIKDAPSNGLSVDYYAGYVKVNGLFGTESTLDLIFKSHDGTSYRVVAKEKNKGMLAVSYLPSLKGKYDIYYVLDGKAYNMNVTKEY